MQKHYETPWHRDLTPAEEEKLLRMEEQMREADKKSPLLMKSHLETFNDGVIAIIITIMVLELPIPSGPQEYKLFLSSIGLFFVSFFIVADFWHDLHRTFESILAERNSWSVVAYGSVYLAVSIVLRGLLFYSLRERFLGFENLFFYMFATSTGTILAFSLILIVLGWYYPVAVMPCYLILPLISFLQPRRRSIRKNSEILRSVDNKSPHDK